MKNTLHLFHHTVTSRRFAFKSKCLKVMILTIFTIVTFSSSIYADNIQWNGGGDGESWMDASNWNGNAVPTDIDNAIFPGGSNLTVIKGTGTPNTVKGIWVYDGAAVSLDLDLSISGITAIRVFTGSTLTFKTGHTFDITGSTKAISFFQPNGTINVETGATLNLFGGIGIGSEPTSDDCTFHNFGIINFNTTTKAIQQNGATTLILTNHICATMDLKDEALGSQIKLNGNTSNASIINNGLIIYAGTNAIFNLAANTSAINNGFLDYANGVNFTAGAGISMDNGTNIHGGLNGDAALTCLVDFTAASDDMAIYNWAYNGTSFASNLPDGTLDLTDAGFSDAGPHTVVVSNTVCFDNSFPVTATLSNVCIGVLDNQKPRSHQDVNWELNDIHTDEFDGGALDLNKWDNNVGDWGTWSWEPDNVYLTDEVLTIRMVQETHNRDGQDFYFNSGIYQNRETVTYGYFESRIKGSDKGQGTCPAFWLYSRGQPIPTEEGGVQYSEIDAIEIFQKAYDEQRLEMNLHTRIIENGVLTWKRPGQGDTELTHNTWLAPWHPSDEYHTYGVWNRLDSIFWYVDGIQRGAKKNHYWHLPMYPTVSMGLRTPYERYINGVRTIMPYPDTEPEPGFPTEMYCDYVRAWNTPAQVYADRELYYNAAFPLDNDLEFRCRYFAGNGEAVLSDTWNGMTCKLQEINADGTVINEWEEVDNMAIGEESGRSDFVFSLDGLLPSSALQAGHQYVLKPVFKTSFNGGEDVYLLEEYYPIELTSDALGIELLDFKVEKKDDAVVLNWQARQLDNDFFMIEKSTDAKNFQEIGKIEALENSIETYSYEFVDNRPHLGSNYYRLKQIDTDGRLEYSDIKRIDFEEKEVVFFAPNPASDFLIIHAIGQEQEKMTLQIFDLNGQLVHEAYHYTDAPQTVDISKLADGIYYFKISHLNAPSSIYQNKFIKASK